MGEIGRQVRKSARRDVTPSGKRFDAACRPISPTPQGHKLAGRAGRAARVVDGLNRSPGYAFQPSPSGSDSARRDDGPILVRNSG